ncbi:MAG: ABC transporter permease [Chloroflexota bacterium]|jgi:spermidine/putrescine transport system permease protein|nr:ABC transporter permease [Chloroflexota bacterium]
MAGWLRRHGGLIPYLFLLPGGLWLVVFFVLPMLTMASVALQEGTLGTGFRLTFNVGIFPEVLGRYSEQFLRSVLYALVVTGLTLAIGYPMAYTIAFRGGRYKNVLLLLVILPFFTSFIIRTISWKFILADQGFLLGTLKEIGILDDGFRLLATPIAVISGITYNYLPFVVLPLYVALEKIDYKLVEAATDLYASRRQAFLRVTLPLSMSGVFAGSLLAFIPAAGDYINAELLGGTRETTMIGNVVQTLYLTNNDYPQASAISLILMLGLIGGVLLYTRALRGQELTV